ncbi:MAG: triose-phosphate isomerase [Candidatus Margulisiibacteriota bacterium]|nr:MAG: triose-phosphate isomerase [Candidatus Margulisbacteria bacterium GWE2_39_32]PZM79651.1 MAG: triose-phosphate isomerase [Candidatus Margulisiibacteriota bacterium]HCT85127.1 triose-phosphate isomerase [Candidatus Margulisiibacteriota bacterium]HCY36269.1 triose-phosphate isomerase [Candidatus Margulisiibacteriota bacterium]
MRKIMIAGNWKMNKTIDEAVELINGIKGKLTGTENCDIVICPTFVCLESAKKAVSGSALKLGAQNLYWKDSGAFTGEISADMLLSSGVEFVIIGHSERRQYFGETDETVNLRLKQALKKGLKPIVCIGETLEERENNKTFTVLDTQLTGGLADISADDMKKIVIAYEPVWAIGTGKVATNEQAQETHAYIRSKIKSMYNAEIADGVIIQYGGSVKPDNAEGLLSLPDIDGALVGGASLKVEDFVGIINGAK